MLSCETTDDCPEDMVCREALGRCVEVTGASGEGPVLLDSPSADPASGTRGTLFTLSFEVNKALLLDPVILVETGSGTAPFRLQPNASDAEAGRYVAVYEADGSEEEGAQAITIDLVDREGNAATGLSGGSIVFDFTPPALAAPASPDPYRATRGSEIALDFVLTEDAGPPPAVSMTNTTGGTTLEWDVQDQEDPRTFTYGYEPAGSDAEGLYGVTITATDVAGNVSGPLSAGQVVLDLGEPTLLELSFSPAEATQGVNALLTLLVDEELGPNPTLAWDAGMGDPGFTFLSRSGLLYTFRRIVDASMLEGTYDLSAVTIEDVAGNACTLTTTTTPELLPASFVVDGSAPEATEITVSHTTVSHLGTFTLSFNVSEALPVEPVATVGAREMTPIAALPTFDYSFELTADEDLDDEGIQNVVITLRDAAGNLGFGSDSIDLDFTPPRVLDTRANPPMAKIGDRVTYTVSASELLSTPPTLTVTDVDTLSFDYETDTQYIFTYVVGGTELGETYDVTVGLLDEAGNPGSDSDVADVVIDANRPVISGVSTTTPSVAGYANLADRTAGNTIDVEFDVDETPGNGFPQVRIGPYPADGCTPSGLHYVCSYALKGAETDGDKLVTIMTTDIAGNAREDTSVSVAFDFSPPELVFKGTTPSLAPRSSSITLTLTFNEEISGSPSVTPTPALPGPAALTEVVGPSTTTFVFSYTAPDTGSNSAHDLDVDATDLAGNTPSPLLDGGIIDLDLTLPSITGVTVLTPNVAGYANFADRTAGNTVTVEFDLSELAAAGFPQVKIGPHDVDLCTPAGLSYSCDYALKGGESDGEMLITISTVDLAGNPRQDTSASVVFDFQAPSLTFSQTSPQEAGADAPVFVTLTFSEEVNGSPTITPSPALPGPSSLAIVDSTATTFTFAYTAPPPGGGDSTHDLDVNAFDLAGNSPSPLLDGGVIAIDRTPPSISNVVVTTPSVASYVNLSDRTGGATMTVGFDLNDTPAAGYPQVKIGPHNADSCTPSGLSFVCQYALKGGESGGEKLITISVLDEAGNQTENTSETVTFDFKAPGIVFKDTAPATASKGGLVFLTLTFDETVVGLPTVTPSPALPGPSTLANISGDGLTFTYEYTAPLGEDVNSSHDLDVDAVDLADNSPSPLLDGGSINLDRATPTISGIVVTTPTVAGYVNLADRTAASTVQINFDLSETPGTGYPQLKIGPHDADTCSMAGLAATCTYDLQGAETDGEKLIAISTTDPAGNAGENNSATVIFDFTPPGLAFKDTAPGLAALGDLVLVTLTFDEEISGTPTATPSPALPGPSSLTNIGGDGITFTYEYTAPGAAAANSSHDLDVDAVDLAGNSPSPLLDGGSVDLDRTVPAIDSIVVTTPTAPGYANLDDRLNTRTIQVNFDLSEPPGTGFPQLKIGPHDADSCSMAGLAATCTYDLQGGEEDGEKLISISSADASGNVGENNTASMIFDFTPPGLAFKDTAPAEAPMGGLVVVTLSLDEEVVGTPTLTPSLALPGPSTLTNTSGDGITFTYEYTAPVAAAADSSHDLDVSAVDLAGNSPSPLLDGGSIELDRTTPSISSIVVATPTVAGYVNLDDRAVTRSIQVNFDLSEPPGTGYPQVKIGPHNADSCTPSGLSFVCQYALKGGETDGEKLITISVLDGAGNQAEDTSEAVNFDFRPPGIVFKDTAPATAPKGSLVFLTLTFDETVVGLPTVAPSPALPGPSTLANISGDGLTFTYEYTAPLGEDVNSSHDLDVDAVDLAGNSPSPLLDGGSIELDRTTPTISNIVVTTPTVAGYANLDDRTNTRTIQVTFDLSEAPGAGYPQVKLGPHDADSCSMAGLAATCTYDLQGAETDGEKLIAISTTDTAGNAGENNSATVIFDFTPPGLAFKDTAPGLAALGDLVLVTLTFDEEISGTPTATPSPALPGPSALTNIGGDGITFTYEYTAPSAAAANSSHDLDVDVVDLAGNSPSPLLDGGIVDLDRTIPAIDNIVVTTPTVAGYANLDDRTNSRAILVTFDLSEPPGTGFPQLKIGPHDADSCSMAGLAATCTYDLQGGEEDGEKLISISTTDASGNVGENNSASVIFDFTPPGLAFKDTAPAEAALGGLVVVTLSFDEEVVGTPTITPSLALPGPGTLGNTSGDGITFTYEYTAPSGAGADSTHDLDVSAVDLAGNSPSPLLDGGSIELDRTIPAIDTIVVTTPTVAGYVNLDDRTTGRTVTVSFNVGEAPGTGYPRAKIGPHDADSCTMAGLAATCTYDLQGGEEDGEKLIAISTADAAGNAGENNTASVIFDFTPPGLAFKDTAPAVAAMGDLVVVTLTFDEEVSGTPTLTPSIALPGPGTLTNTGGDGVTFTYEYAALAGEDADSTHDLDVNATDLAGNTPSPLLDGGSIVLDRTTPVISAIVITTPTVPDYANLADQASNATISIGFHLSEAPGAGSPQLKIGPHNADSCSMSGLDATCIYDLTGGETDGEKLIAISSSDAAGNAGENNGATMIFDFTPPGLLFAETVPEVAGMNELVTLTLTFDEEVNGTPSITPSTALPGPSTLTNVSGDGVTFTYEYTAPGAGVNSTHDLDVGVPDLAGNYPSPLLDGGVIELDRTAPGISGATVTAPTVAGYANRADRTNNRTITVVFVLDEDPAAGFPQVRIGPYPADSCTPTGLSYSCTYDLQGGESDGEKLASIMTMDIAGNTHEDTSASIMFDFTRPGIVPGSVNLQLTAKTMLSGQNNPLHVVNTATWRTEARLTFATDEPVRTDADAPSLTAINGADEPFTITYVPTTAFSFTLVLEGAPPPDPAQGSYTVTARLRDLAGNVRATTPLLPELPTHDLVVDTLLPSAPDVATLDRIIYTRVPWGADPTGGIKTFSLRGDVTPNTTLIVYDGPETSTAGEIGRLEIDGTGSFGAPIDGAPLFELNRSDRVLVYATVADDAGNLSDADPVAAGYQAAAVRNVEWIASLGDKLAGSSVENPHGFMTQTSFVRERWHGRVTGAMSQPGELEPTSFAELSLPDDDTVESSAQPSFRQRALLDASIPPELSGHDMAYDARRGKVVLYGGMAGSQIDETWEFDGTRWDLVCGAGTDCTAPNARSGHRMAYDSLRGVVVMTGGWPSSSAHTFEWDGSKWTQVCGSAVGCTGFPSRESHGLAFDSGRGRLVLFGGSGDTDDTWEWDGAAWEEVCTAAPCSPPPARDYPGMVYDSLRGVVVMFGGWSGGLTNDTWEWDGESWTEVCTTAPCNTDIPDTRYQHRMAYDSHRGVSIVFGGWVGFMEGSDTWEWNGVRWRERCTVGCTRPSARRHAAMAFDSVRGKTVLFAGPGPLDHDDTWEWDGESWQQVCLDQASCGGPSARAGHDMAYDVARDRTVMFGGQVDTGSCDGELTNWCRSTWEWNGAGWQQVCTGAPCNLSLPAAREHHAMAHDRSRGRTVLFGGDTGGPDCGTGTQHCDDTWEWDGSAWLKLCGSGTPCSGPMARTFPALTYAGGNRVILFGGDTGGPDCGAGTQYCDDTWLWDGGRWAQLCGAGTTCTGPEPRYATDMAFDEDRGVIVLRSGRGATSYMDTWELDLATWTWSEICEPCGAVAWSRAHTLVYDPTRRRMLSFGGLAGGYMDSVHEYDGARWDWVCGGWMPCVAPQGRWRHATVYDSKRREVVMFGGEASNMYTCDNSSTRLCDGTWRYHSGGASQPGHVFSVAFSAAQGPRGIDCRVDPAACPVRSVEFLAAAGGESSPLGVALPGSRLLSWQLARWKEIAANSGTLVSPESLQWSTTDPLLISRLFFGTTGDFVVALAPTATSGDSDDWGTVGTDYAEARVLYYVGPSCGDGVVDGEETCDDRNHDNGDGCNADCLLEGGICSDNVRNAGEECDDGDLVDGNGCSSTCTAEPAVCGDPFVQPGEECDDGDAIDGNGCDTNCTPTGCGNGIVTDTEECDDGNQWDGDGCSATCLLQSASCASPADITANINGAPVDGDTAGAPANQRGICATGNAGELAYSITPAEAGVVFISTVDPTTNFDTVLSVRTDCEDVDTELMCNDDSEGMASSLALPVTGSDTYYILVDGSGEEEGLFRLTLSTCGDGVIQAGEACDDGEDNSDTVADACRTNCVLPICGDGVADAGEECDNAGANHDTDPDACRTTCLRASCGDLVIDSGEECDDGPGNNDLMPDACRTTCMAAGCGDGTPDTGESCDDGNGDIFDGCTPDCLYIELFFDDFEPDFGPDWDVGVGNFPLITSVSVSPTHSLDLWGTISYIESDPKSTALCTTLEFEYQAKRGLGAYIPPDGDDSLRLRYRNNVGMWQDADVLFGNNGVDPTFLPRTGSIANADAFHGTFRIRLESDGDFGGDDDFVSDDIRILCNTN